ncbi:hypothetical protein SELMODRAFT_428358 [Selaginella moellendorffii]|uniref:START domain-containing protein n=1 Tax=Selaginella moellendorffii TaxID=88036 RepID=D8T2K4_SELML|nr:hypothetical protein SELMODRAFT_428358 [Selaginella moellendorffii]
MLVTSFELELPELDAVVGCLRTVPQEVETIVKETIHGFNASHLPPPKEGVIRMEANGGFILQKISDEKCYIRAVIHLDLKLDLVPTWVINFLGRQVVGHGFRLYLKRSLRPTDTPEKSELIHETYARPWQTKWADSSSQADKQLMQRLLLRNKAHPGPIYSSLGCQSLELTHLQKKPVVQRDQEDPGAVHVDVVLPFEWKFRGWVTKLRVVNREDFPQEIVLDSKVDTISSICEWTWGGWLEIKTLVAASSPDEFNVRKAKRTTFTRYLPAWEKQECDALVSSWRKRVTDYESGSEEAKEITQRVNAAEMAFEWFGGNQGAHLHALKHAPGGAQVETCVRAIQQTMESSKIHGEALWVSRFLHLNPWNLSVFGFRHPSRLPFVLGRLDALDDRRILPRLGVRKECVRERSNCVRIDAAELLDQLVPSPARQARCVVEREGMENVAFVWVQPDGELRGIQATQTSRDGSFPLHRGRRIPESLSPRETVAALKSNGLDGIF